MSADINDVYQRLRARLSGSNPIPNPPCPAPEALWDWVEQKEAHPQSVSFLAHCIACAACRLQYVEMCEISGLVAEAKPVPVTRAASHLPATIREWAQRLLAEGWVAPVSALRNSFAHLDRLALAPGAATTRSPLSPGGLQPNNVAVRVAQPMLRWKRSENAQEYIVAVAVPQESLPPRLLWAGTLAATNAIEMEFTLPHEAKLEPEGIYVWQVIARDAEQEEYQSPTAAFVVLSAELQQQVTILEQEVGGDRTALVGIYEAHGLYEEAWQEAQSWHRNSQDTTALRVYTELARRLNVA